MEDIDTTLAVTAATIERLSIDNIQADPETRDLNEARFSSERHYDVCFTCGRGLTEKAVTKGWMVHLATDGTLWASSVEDCPEDLDQGWFPVGSECAKRIPLAYRQRSI